ncbi:hypothetical protein ACTFIV_005605 [Dictyostelium citrinum]
MDDPTEIVLKNNNNNNNNNNTNNNNTNNNNNNNTNNNNTNNNTNNTNNNNKNKPKKAKKPKVKMTADNKQPSTPTDPTIPKKKKSTDLSAKTKKILYKDVEYEVTPVVQWVPKKISDATNTTTTTIDSSNTTTSTDSSSETTQQQQHQHQQTQPSKPTTSTSKPAPKPKKDKVKKEKKPKVVDAPSITSDFSNLSLNSNKNTVIKDVTSTSSNTTLETTETITTTITSEVKSAITKKKKTKNTKPITPTDNVNSTNDNTTTTTNTSTEAKKPKKPKKTKTVTTPNIDTPQTEKTNSSTPNSTTTSTPTSAPTGTATSTSTPSVKKSKSKSKSPTAPSTNSNEDNRENQVDKKIKPDKKVKSDKDKSDKKDKSEKGDKKKRIDKKEKINNNNSNNNNRPEKKDKKKSSKSDKEEGNNNNSEVKKKKRTRLFYKSYVKKEDFEQGLVDGKYFFGTIRVNPKRYYDAYITVEGCSHDVFCGGLKDRNRSFNNDIVAFEILDEKEWKKRPKKDEDEDDTIEATNNNNNITSIGEEIVDEEDEDDEVTIGAILKDVSTSVNEGDEGTVVLLENQDLSKKMEIENQLLKEQMSDSKEIEVEIDSEDNNTTSTTTTTTTTITTITDDEEEDDSDEGFVKIESSPKIVPSAKPSKKNNHHNYNNNDHQNLIQKLEKIEKLTLKAFENKQYVSVRVVYIVEEKHVKNHVGIMIDENVNSIFTSFVPMDTTLPKCCIFKESIPQYKSNPEKYKKSLVSVGYSGWKETSLLPVGHYKSLFGECGKIEPETYALLSEFGVETDPFSKAVMECLPKIDQSKLWLPSVEDLKGRRDLRDVEICTIDPDTAKDLDDALHCIELEDGNFEVGVHIADVSHFVKPDTALDKCAQRKATTVYLVQKAIPMLPSLLSEELCSLNMGVERLAFSVIWKLSPTGEILDEWFGRSVIKSFSRLTYAIAQALIDDKITNAWEDWIPADKMRKDLGPNTPQHIARVKKGVMGLRSIAKHMRANRIANGAFTIHPSKLAFALDDNGNPISTKIYPIYESNNLVEEYMLLANMRVAERIGKFFPSNALLRRHPSPNENKLESFISFCAKHGFEIDSSSSLTFGESIKKLKDTCTDINILMAIQLLSIRSMKLAEYFCSNNEEEEDWRHYALNAPFYTHFTSPIRRYADIIVHRLLDLSIQIEKSNKQHQSSDQHHRELPSSDSITAICKNCNEKKLNARKAQERSDKVFLCVLLENHPTTTEAVALNTGASYIVCIVPQFGSEQKIYLDDLQKEGTIVSHSYDATNGINIIHWPSLDNTTSNDVVIQKISQLTPMKVQIRVNKDKFPIDTRCVLVHPDTIIQH